MNNDVDDNAPYADVYTCGLMLNLQKHAKAYSFLRLQYRTLKISLVSPISRYLLTNSLG